MQIHIEPIKVVDLLMLKQCGVESDKRFDKQ